MLTLPPNSTQGKVKIDLIIENDGERLVTCIGPHKDREKIKEAELWLVEKTPDSHPSSVKRETAACSVFYFKAFALNPKSL